MFLIALAKTSDQAPIRLIFGHILELNLSTHYVSPTPSLILQANLCGERAEKIMSSSRKEIIDGLQRNDGRPLNK
jgi:hypothetical protein